MPHALKAVTIVSPSYLRGRSKHYYTMIRQIGSKRTQNSPRQTGDARCASDQYVRDKYVESLRYAKLSPRSSFFELQQRLCCVLWFIMIHPEHLYCTYMYMARSDWWVVSWFSPHRKKSVNTCRVHLVKHCPNADLARIIGIL